MNNGGLRPSLISTGEMTGCLQGEGTGSQSSDSTLVLFQIEIDSKLPRSQIYPTDSWRLEMMDVNIDFGPRDWDCLFFWSNKESDETLGSRSLGREIWLFITIFVPPAIWWPPPALSKYFLYNKNIHYLGFSLNLLNLHFSPSEYKRKHGDVVEIFFSKKLCSYQLSVHMMVYLKFSS